MIAMIHGLRDFSSSSVGSLIRMDSGVISPGSSVSPLAFGGGGMAVPQWPHLSAPAFSVFPQCLQCMA